MFELLLPLTLPLLAGAAVMVRLVFGDRSEGRRFVERWQAVAAGLGWREIDWSLNTLGSPRLKARAGRRRVRLERRVSDNGSFTMVTVEGNSGITLRPENPERATALAFGPREIEIGDERFDQEVEIRGAPERVRAMLDAETRGIVLRMLNGRLAVPGRPTVVIRGTVSLIDGNLVAALGEQPLARSADELSAALEALLALAERFQRPLDIPAQLASTVGSEPLWPVRLQGLQVLSIGFPGDPATATALRLALADERAEVRLQAALALGDEGRATLLAIAAEEKVDDATAAQAIFALGEACPVELAIAGLRKALRQRHLQTASACIDTIGKGGGAEARELLAKVVSLESGQLAVVAAQALGKTGAADVEDSLVKALARGVPEITLAAIEALGRVGSVRAVPAIQEAATRLGSEQTVRRAARQAVARIQSRLPGASPGQLSIAEDGAGLLSLADEDPRGRVSLPVSEPGR